MTETEIEYTHESVCEECGHVVWGSGNPTDFTLSADAKEQHGFDAPADHDCEFTEHIEWDEPVTQAVDY